MEMPPVTIYALGHEETTILPPNNKKRPREDQKDQNPRQVKRLLSFVNECSTYWNLDYLYAHPDFDGYRRYVEQVLFQNFPNAKIFAIEGNANYIFLFNLEFFCVKHHKENKTIRFSVADNTCMISCFECGNDEITYEPFPKEYHSQFFISLYPWERQQLPSYLQGALLDNFRPSLAFGDGLTLDQKSSKLPRGEIFTAISYSSCTLLVKMFLKMCQNKIVYCEEEKCFYYYTNPVWKKDPFGYYVSCLFNRHVADQLRWLLYDLELEKDGESKKWDRPGAVPIQSSLSKNIEQVTALWKKYGKITPKAQLMVELAVACKFKEKWDNIPNFLPTLDQLVDLRTGQGRPILPTDYLLNAANFEWKGISEEKETWEKFVLDIMGGKSELAAFMKRSLGYIMTGCRREHVFYMFYGPHGRNGKDTLLKTLNTIFGHMFSSIPDSIFLSKGDDMSKAGARPDLLDLKGKRGGYHGESDKFAKFNEALLKSLSGNTEVKARGLYSDYQKFYSMFTPILQTNYRPSADGNDAAFWARAILITFDQVFVDRDPEKKCEHRMDKDLDSKLLQEAHGIIAWIVQGAMEYHRQGLGIPTEIKEAVKSYKEDEDVVGQFLGECCTEGDYDVQSSDLYTAYENWCKKRGIKAQPSKYFVPSLEKRGFRKKRTRESRMISGLKLVRSELLW